ncbi:hypothetical protein DFH06DRAFT_1122362 [Mycena polygramma]|nr:hypothetical protein DFH06DRAFT_1122362 [Mycena polygramma]
MVAFPLFIPLILVARCRTAVAFRRPSNAVVVRQAPDCSNECAAFDNNELSNCNNTVVNEAVACFDCMIKSGDISQSSAQGTLDDFVGECNADGTPVTSIALSGSGSAGAATVTPVPTSAAAKPTTAADEPTEDGGDPTDTAGDETPAPSSANSTDSAAASASASGASESTKHGSRVGHIVMSGVLGLVAFLI